MVDLTHRNKNRGQVYTPKFIVDNVLDMAGYFGEIILKKHVIDNSCGDGAFLVEIVKRYCYEYLKCYGNYEGISTDLEFYIHGIEIQEEEVNACLKNLEETLREIGISEDVKFDIICANSLLVEKFNSKMDFVVGNPPYIRVHNLGDSYSDTKKFNFAKGGMTDIYIVFYEIGLRMLNKNGVLSYITPSSFFTSIAGYEMRKSFVQNNNILSIVDLKHFQPFNATTYTTIVTLAHYKKDSAINYYLYDCVTQKPVFCRTYNKYEFVINSNFYFGSLDELKDLNNIVNNPISRNLIDVKNGFATLADKILIGDFDFDDEFVIKVKKGSTGKWTKCIYPYKNGKIVCEDELKKHKKLYSYLLNFKDDLCKRSLDKGTPRYGFGRSQAISDVDKDKISINTLIRDESDLKIEAVPKGSGIYSGLYILTDLPINVIENSLRNKNFVSYISMLGKYKSGGYYSFSSNDLKHYLNYVLEDDIC